MREIRIGIIGLGTIGSALVETLTKNKVHIERTFGVSVIIVGLCDVNVRLKKRYRNFFFTADAQQILMHKEIDVVVELIGGRQPALTFIQQALRSGKDVVTANKALLAEQGKGIFALACRYGRNVKLEAAVGGGIPLIKSISENLILARIKSVHGIVNGTTNFILSEMSQNGESFAKSLERARELGFAEKNASLDLNGVDSLHKIVVLVYLCFGAWVDWRKVSVEGITSITPSDIVYARDLGYAIKLLAVAKKIDSQLEVRVHPALVPFKHPLSKTNGSFNAIFLDTELAGDFLFYGLGAGGSPTSVAVLSDILTLAREEKEKSFCSACTSIKKPLRKKGDLTFRYYIRFTALDKPGVLAQVSRILAERKISIASVTQKERQKARYVPIVILTHRAQEKNMLKAREKIDRLSLIKPPIQVIRIEEP